MRGQHPYRWLLVIATPLAAACCLKATAQDNEEGKTMGDRQGSITVRWWGQACLSFSDSKGVCVLNDPFPAGFGYPQPDVTPQVCLVSHEHRDHNGIDNVKGTPTIIRGPGPHEAAGIKFRGVATHHDDQQGGKRGANTVFVWEMAGLKIAHMGDLGRLLTAEEVKDIGPADVIAVPVGGYYTIEPVQAVEVAKQVQAKVVLPMHYRTAAVPRLPVAPVESFLEVVPKDWTVEKPEALTVTLSSETLPKESVRVVVLKYE